MRADATLSASHVCSHSLLGPLSSWQSGHDQRLQSPHFHAVLRNPLQSAAGQGLMNARGASLSFLTSSPARVYVGRSRPPDLTRYRASYKVRSNAASSVLSAAIFFSTSSSGFPIVAHVTRAALYLAASGIVAGIRAVSRSARIFSLCSLYVVRRKVRVNCVSNHSRSQPCLQSVFTHFGTSLISVSKYVCKQVRHICIWQYGHVDGARVDLLKVSKQIIQEAIVRSATMASSKFNFYLLLTLPPAGYQSTLVGSVVFGSA